MKSGTGSLSGRRVPLDGITTDDVAELRIAKSLLPQDAGEGIGGTVEVTSRKPLDYKEAGFRVDSQGRFSEFSEKWGQRTRLSFNSSFNENVGAKFSVSFRRREIRNFELDASSSNLLFVPEIFDVDGNPVSNDVILDDLDDPGDSFDNVNSGFLPLHALTFEEQTYEVQDQRHDSLNVNGAIQWQLTEATDLLLGGRFNRQKARATENSLAFDNDDDDFEEIDGTIYTIFNDPELDFESQIEDELLINNSIYLKMVTELERLTLKYQVSYANAETSAPETSIDFDTGSLLDDDTVTFVPFTFSGTFFPSPNPSVVNDADFLRAIEDIPGTQLFDDFTTDLTNERTNERTAFKFDVFYEMDTDLGGLFLHNIQSGFQFERSEVADDVLTLVYLDAGALNLDGTFDPDFESTGEGEYLEDFGNLFGGYASLGPIGSPLQSIGINGIPILDEGEFRQLISRFTNSFLDSGEEPYYSYFLQAKEDLVSVYFQTGFEIGRLSGVGGVRIEQYQGSFASPLSFGARLVTVNLTDPLDENSDVTEVIDLRSDADLSVIQSDTDNLEILPRFNLLCLVNDSVQIRAGVGYAIARPTFSQLGRSTSMNFLLEAEADNVGDTPVLPGVADLDGVISAGLNLDELTEIDLVVRSGNPQLNNARSLSFDVSLEYYPTRGTAITVGLFRKDIENFIFIGSESAGGGIDLDLIKSLLSPNAITLIEQLGDLETIVADDVVDDLEVIQPRNGSSAIVSGIELSIIHQFSYAPGWLSDIGFSASLAYTDSEAEIVSVVPATSVNPDGGLADDEALVVLGYAEEGDGVSRYTDFFNAPSLSGNLSLYYESDNLEIALSLQHQSTAFDSLDDFGMDQYSGSYSQWDMYAEYKIPEVIGLDDMSVYIEIPDITDSGRNPTDLQSLGRIRDVIDEVSFNGREIQIGIRASF